MTYRELIARLVGEEIVHLDDTVEVQVLFRDKETGAVLDAVNVPLNFWVTGLKIEANGTDLLNAQMRYY